VYPLCIRKSRQRWRNRRRLRCLRRGRCQESPDKVPRYERVDEAPLKLRREANQVTSKHVQTDTKEPRLESHSCASPKCTPADPRGESSSAKARKIKRRRRGALVWKAFPSAHRLPRGHVFAHQLHGRGETARKNAPVQCAPAHERVFLDFKPIRRVDLPGALVVAAELDRWNRLNRGKLRSIDVNEWDPGVRRLLREIGFFGLLDVSSGAAEKPAPSDERYVKFMSGTEVDGKGFSLLREAELDPFIGVPNREQLFAAVTEAMTNVSHHAYHSKIHNPALKRWWLSASFNVATREIVILIYDQGRGIPKTVRRNWRDYLRKIAPGSMSDDAKLIREAHGLRRSASGQEHRGLGLERDVRKYIEKLNCRGIYCINSLKGQYTVETGADSRVGEIVNFRHSLNGTLIEWRVILNETQ